MSPRAGALAGYGVAAALLLVGTLLATRATRPADFGWFAYTPLLPEAPPLLPVWGWGLLGALALVGAGLLMVAATTGWLVGRRSGRRVQWVLPAVLAAVGAALVALGVGVLRAGVRAAEGATVAFTVAPSGPSQLARWFWTPEQVAGTGMVALGLLLAVAALGSLAGHRVRLREPRAAAVPPPAPAGRG